MGKKKTTKQKRQWEIYQSIGKILLQCTVSDTGQLGEREKRFVPRGMPIFPFERAGKGDCVFKDYPGRDVLGKHRLVSQSPLS